MNSEFYVFVEAFNCGAILRKCLESFHRHHDFKIHIIGTTNDFNQVGEIIDHKNNVLVNWDNNQLAKEYWASSHLGTALSFATAIKNGSKYIVHIDSDCYFKGECLSEMFNLLSEGFDVVGTPRPYKNNLSGIKGLDLIPDCVSTYFMGINTEKIPGDIEFNTLVRMCVGGYSYTGDNILDFFDPVTHSIIRNGGKVFFLSTEEYGGIDLEGSKFNGFNTNLNFDCGKKIVHFGGVGTGKAVNDNLSNPNKSYGEWAYYRWNFYSHLFYNTEIDKSKETEYSGDNDHNGKRWCNGCASEDIIEDAKIDIGL
jgi:hypothetical protein